MLERPPRLHVRARRAVIALVAAAVVAAACSPSGTETTPTSTQVAPTTAAPEVTAPEVTPSVDLVDARSHTASVLRSIDDYDAIARSGIGEQAVVKFSITEFSTDPQLVWLDSNFYSLHDEWYWFQLLNGSSVRGFDTEPELGLEGAPDGFDTLDDAYEWARDNESSLPLDLRFTSLGRLFSPYFYERVLDSGTNRRLGVGSLIRTPDPDTGADRWIIELEYSDEVTVEQIDRYFATVGATLPEAISDELVWVPRSRAQELVADAIEAGNGPNADRVIRYEDLSTPGDIEVYSSAIAAGRLLVVTDGGRWSLSDAGPNDIVAIDRAPDDLPAGNGLITGTPQTPLAHVNILALNRGVPNAFLAGLGDDPVITQLGRVRAPVLVQTTADGELEIIALTDAEYRGWLDTQGKTPIAVPAVDPAEIELVKRIAELDDQLNGADDLEALRPVIGGKAAGFVELAAPGTTTMPPDALVLTVKAYLEHMVQFQPTVEALLADTDLDSSRGRFLFLEGRDDYDERYTSGSDQDFADDFTDSHAVGTPIGDALAADGFVRQIRSSTIEPATMETITAELEADFGSYAPTQGLRFRSSSTVEDIEGFNGAGLYDSNTGYLDPTLLDDSADHKRTVERAILRTWSSYWSANAFEERQRENVSHRSGAMAVLVHARFDDDLEVSNGVATLTLHPDPGATASMSINVQSGAVSVTNADDESGLLPEVIEVRRSSSDGSLVDIVRRSTSSITAPDDVLDDDTVLALFTEAEAVAQSWLARSNDLLPPEQRSSTLTLDLEFRHMAAGWPALTTGIDAPSRMIIKQARTLDPGLRGIDAELLELSVPRDILAHTIRAVRLTCSDGLTGVELFIDPLARIDFGLDGPFEQWTADPVGVDIDTCSRTDISTSPTQYLLDLLATRS